MIPIHFAKAIHADENHFPKGGITNPNIPIKIAAPTK